MPETLNNLSKLRDSKFGRPDPRHGLRLLWWFAHEYVRIDSNGVHALHDPADGRFGFHRFRNEEKILPINQEYYETGNLRTSNLPNYVTAKYIGNSDASNTDRIIVSVWPRLNNKLKDVYVTQHLDHGWQFDPNRTYRISPDLIGDIKNLDRSEFLEQMKNDQNFVSVRIEPFQGVTNRQQSSPSRGNCCSCKIICAVVCGVGVLLGLAVLILALYFYINSKKKINK